ncbi:MAG: hypothetical protein OEW19_21450, partial [Acidobacteriota bacterium]|nr:hypothetical protein [Acidobacteriota bacterium]
LENTSPRRNTILARLAGGPLAESGVIAGMSGSPVYVDGKLLGAVSFGWPFAHEAIAGITPAELMRSMLDQPQEVAAAAVMADDWSFSGLVKGELTETDLRRSLATLHPAGIGEAAAAIQWASVGFGTRVRDLLAEEVGAVASAGSQGSAAIGGSAALEPGSAVAAVLVDGDLRLAATGTVTDRSGEAVLAFGHPFLGLGPLEIPMASAEILTVMSSQWSSFKVANLGPVVGAIDFDYLTGIRGALGKVAATIPMTVRLGGDVEGQVRVSLAKIPTLTPTLAAISLLGSLSAVTESVGAQSLDLRLRFDLGDDGSLFIDQSFDGTDSGLAAAIHVFGMASYLLRNRLAAIDIEAIEIDLVSHREPRSLTLVGAHPSRTVVRPGDALRLNVDLAGYRNGKQRRVIELAVPSDLAAGRYMLLVGDGQSIDAVRLAVEQFEPMTFRQALGFLNSLHSTRELRVLGIVEGPGLSVAGEVLPDLPGSIRSLWSASGAGGAKPLRMAVAEEAGIRLDEPVEGLLRVDLEVKKGEPVGGEPGPGAEQPAPGARAERSTAGGGDG